MKALILFDGSRSSQLSLLTACEDAHRRARSDTAQLETDQVLVLTFEKPTAYPQENNGGADQLAAMLEQAIKRLECCGEFIRINAEVIRCHPSEVTSVLIERAREWKTEALYLPVTSKNTEPVKSHTGWWANWRKQSAKPTSTWLEPGPTTLAISASRFQTSLLMQEAQCKLVLVDEEGTATRLRFCQPVGKPASRPQVRQEAKSPEVVKQS